jgi:hypothetical protein
MMPGPTLLKKCSSCGRLIEEETLMSGNTCGAVFWTDGKFDAPMLPDLPELVKCPFCKTLLWIEDLKVVGDAGTNRYDGFVPLKAPSLDLTTTKPYKTPSLKDYFGLLNGGGQSLERKKYLRLRAWHAGNDRRRESEHGPGKFKNKKDLSLIPLSDAEIRNMKDLTCILDEQDDEERVLKAELFRELGFFNRCLSCLAKTLAEDYSLSASFIKGLVEKHDPWVREHVCAY